MVGQIVAPVFKDIVSQLAPRYYQMSPYVKESTPVAVKAANTPEPKPEVMVLLHCPNFTGFTYGEVRDWLHKGQDLPLNRMELVRLHLR